MKMKEENEKVDLKLNIQKNKSMVSGPITSWQVDEETMETLTEFIFLGSIITADGDCSHKIKRHLLYGGKAMTNLGSILKIRDITLLTKVHIVKAMVFPVVMYRCESWTIKAESQRIDAFQLLYWRRLLRFPWSARKSYQSIIQEINLDYLLEGLMLKTQYFGTWCEEPTHWKNRGQDGLMVSLTQWTWVRASSRRWWRTGKPGELQSMRLQRVGHNWVTK